MLKIKQILIVLIVSLSFVAKADEGMWLPFLMNQYYSQMQEAGCKLSKEQIFDLNNACLKDAVVQFGNGCTGEVISKKGLILTNHHCGYGQIQDHSSPENDYIKEGFWAKKMNEELPNLGLTVSFLRNVQDVTDLVLEGTNNVSSEEERNVIISNNISKINDDNIEEGGFLIDIESFYGGNEFYMFKYEVFRDVRLVGAPPFSIGKFGADTDNWTWPRHKGDFCLFRVYANKENKPADYDINNVPLTPKYSLPISIKEYKEGDYTMILGYPGSTDRFMTSYEVEKLMTKTAPTIVDIRTKKLDIIKEDMIADNDIFIKYASKQAGISNYWKYFIGQIEQLEKNKVISEKIKIENEFTKWAESSKYTQEKYGEALIEIKKAVDDLNKYEIAWQYMWEGGTRGSEIISFARNGVFLKLKSSLESNDSIEILNQIILEARKKSDSYFKDYNVSTDKKVFAEILKMFSENVEEEFKPEFHKLLQKKFKSDYLKFTDYLFSTSIFASQEKLNSFLDKPDLKVLEKDLALKIMYSLEQKRGELSILRMQSQEILKKGMRLYIDGLRQMQPEKVFYPDANFTMRLTYGNIKSYQPRNGVKYDYYTTIAGVMEKEKPGDWEFDVRPKQKELVENKEFGIYGTDDLRINFITTNDITGGNSGSPVLNADGELIGVAFDGNWEAMSGDILFEPTVQRTIVCDIRYVLWTIEKYANAQNIIDELDIRN